MSKLLVDTLPLSDNPFLSNDYNSLFVYSAIMDPLVLYNKKNKIICHAAKSFVYNDDKLCYQFCLRNDLRFSNGELVTAKDYVDSINYIISNKCYAKFLYENISKTEYFENCLIIYLKQKDLTFLEKFSYYFISPYKNNISSGPYQILRIRKNKIVLVRNKFYRIKEKNPINKKLCFILSKNLETDLRNFKHKKIDLTAPTLFPLDKIKKYDANVSQNNLFFVLKFNIKYFDKQYDLLRKNICKCIHKKRIVEILNNVYIEKNNFLFNYNYLKKNLNKKLSNFTVNDNIKFNLGYCDFYPNKIIAEEIKRQLEQYGFKINLNICALAKANNNDLNLEINFFAGRDKGTVYISKYFKLIHGEQYAKLAREYEKTLDKKYLYSLCEIQKTQCKIIPLLRSKNIYLKSANLKYFNLDLLNYFDL